MSLELILNILWNSFASWLVVPLTSEIYWFSLHTFGLMPMLLPTLLAILASTLAMLTSYLIGWLIAIDRQNMPLTDEKYQRAANIMHNRLVWLLMIPWIPLLPVFALACGFLRCGLWRLVPLVLLGRVVYYSFYLYQ